MTTKLTLSMDGEVVRDVKRIAKKQGTSVSAMFENYARSIIRLKHPGRPMTPITRKATGMMKLPPGKTDREVLEDALLEKYGLR